MQCKQLAERVYWLGYKKSLRSAFTPHILFSRTDELTRFIPSSTSSVLVNSGQSYLTGYVLSGHSFYTLVNSFYFSKSFLFLFFLFLFFQLIWFNLCLQRICQAVDISFIWLSCSHFHSLPRPIFSFLCKFFQLSFQALTTSIFKYFLSY